MLGIVLNTQSINNSDEGDKNEDIPKDQAKPVNLAENK
jgi:hypothetical protein